MQLYQSLYSHILKAVRKLYFIAQVSKSCLVDLKGTNPTISHAKLVFSSQTPVYVINVFQ